MVEQKTSAKVLSSLKLHGLQVQDLVVGEFTMCMRGKTARMPFVNW